MTTLAERDEQIIALRRQPGITLESIGEHFGLTRGRVWQIVTKAGLVYEHAQARRCLRCGKKIGKHNLSDCCRSCGVQVRAEARPWYTCETCGIQFQPKQWWDKKAPHRCCSTDCRDAARRGVSLGRRTLVPYKLEGWVPQEEMPSPHPKTLNPALTQWAEQLAEHQGQMVKLIVDSRREATNIASNWRHTLKQQGRYGVTRTVSENGKFTVYLGAGPKEADA